MRRSCGVAFGLPRAILARPGLRIAWAGLPLILAASCAAGSSISPGVVGGVATPRIIIDTDLSLYWDDVTALGMANVLQQQGKVQVLGVMSDIRNSVAAAAIDAVDTAYGHSRIPVGAVADSRADTVRDGYSDALVRQLPHAIRSSDDASDAVDLYRRLLASQPDHSVTVVAIGADTNLAGLLGSRPGQGSPLGGRALIAKKVSRLVIEDGLFPGGAPVPLTNTKYDVAATRAVVSSWPTQVAWVDGYVGIYTKVGATLCSTTAPKNPMRIVYEALFGCGPPQDGNWDGPTMLYAIAGSRGLFTELGRGGGAIMNPQGGLSWHEIARGPGEVYVHVGNQQALNDRIEHLLETP